MKKVLGSIILSIASFIVCACGGDGDKQTSGPFVPAEKIPVNSLTISNIKSSINVGSSHQLLVTILPDNATIKTVSWTSSNPSVAQVSSSGLVKAIASGKVNITASCDGKSDACTITVTDYVEFDDVVFKSYCLDNFDKNKDGFISQEEANDIRSISILEKNIKSLKGIERFSNLRLLEVQYCPSLHKLDLTGCKSLQSLYCSMDSIEELDLSPCPNLQTLHCNGNQIKKLSLKGCTKVTEIHCLNNQLEVLDLTDCKELRRLNCEENKIKKLDFSKCISIALIDCEYNSLTEINLQGCNNLMELYCNDNNLTKLDLSHFTTLQIVHCYNNAIESLEIKDNFYFDRLRAENNQLKILKIINSPYISTNYIYNNPNLTTIQLENSSIGWFACYGGNIEELDLTKTNAKSGTIVAWPMPSLKTIRIIKGTILSLWVSNNGTFNEIYNLDGLVTVIEEVE